MQRGSQLKIVLNSGRMADIQVLVSDRDLDLLVSCAGDDLSGSFSADLATDLYELIPKLGDFVNQFSGRTGLSITIDRTRKMMPALTHVK